MLARQTSDEGAIPSGSTITSVVRLSARPCVRRRHRGSRAMTRLSGPGYVWRRWLTVYEYLGGFDSLQGRHGSSARPRDTISGSSFNGRMLSSHGGDGGSSPPESTHSHILACVCGRPARHAIATRNNPVRLRADALSYPEGLSTNLPPSGQARRVPLPIRETPDLGRRYCRSGAPGWTRSPGTGEKRVRLPRSAPRPRSRAAHRSRPGPAPAALGSPRSRAATPPRMDAPRVSEAW
jgi:hypothetical protein